MDRKFCILFLLIFFLGTEAVTAQSVRESRQPPEQIMDSIGVRSGMVIGDAGAGHGYMTFPLARRVGTSGKVYANDILSDRLEEIRQKAKSDGLANIETVEGAVEDPLFPSHNLDMILMVYVLHDLEKPNEFLRNLKKYLKKDASLVIIEKEINEQSGSNERSHFLTPERIKGMAQDNGYQIKHILTFLPYDTIYLLNL